MLSYRPRYYLLRPWKIITELWQPSAAFIQRGKRGWAICDTWQADRYIADVLAGMCQYVATNTTGTPYPFYTQENGDEAYIAYLEGLASAFRDYANFMSENGEWGNDIGNVRYAQLIERMRPLFDHFATISD